MFMCIHLFVNGYVRRVFISLLKGGRRYFILGPLLVRKMHAGMEHS